MSLSDKLKEMSDDAKRQKLLKREEQQKQYEEKYRKYIEKELYEDTHYRFYCCFKRKATPLIDEIVRKCEKASREGHIATGMLMPVKYYYSYTNLSLLIKVLKDDNDFKDFKEIEYREHYYPELYLKW